MKEGNASPDRLASCPLQELKTDSIIGVITNQTKDKCQLGNVSFLCIVNKTSTDQFKLHLELKMVLPEEATNHPSFDVVRLMVRCLQRNDNSLGIRHQAGHYLLVYSK